MKKLNTNLTLAAALTLALATLGGAAHAEDAPVAKPDHEVTYNVAVTTDYRYRGISQSRRDPALQGGADYTNNPTGLYLGTWLSTIKWTKDAGGDGNVEWDIYGGKRGELVKDVSYDIGGLGYVYPSNDLHPSANTFELYGQLGYGPAYIKYSHSTTNLFGYSDSKNSGYLDIGVNYDVYGGYILNLHAGHQKVKNNSAFSYNDYKIGVTKDFGVVTASLAAVRGDLPTFIGTVSKNLAKTGLVLTVSKTF
ncbi:MAG: hypothetical protein H7Z39_13800 [Burkholderiaceae bacterium]|nr:hypothetical protein [Burkholderiaceae bacterium]